LLPLLGFLLAHDNGGRLYCVMRPASDAGSDGNTAWRMSIATCGRGLPAGPESCHL